MVKDRRGSSPGEAKNTYAAAQCWQKGYNLMFETPPRYRSYLLMLWEERRHDPNQPVAWRFSLEDPRTRQRRGFANLEALVAALTEEMAKERTKGQDAAQPSSDLSGLQDLTGLGE